MRSSKVRKKTIVIIFTLCLLTSCWDLREIEEIGFVLALAIDPLNEKEQKHYETQYKKETGKDSGPFLKTTFQIVIPSALTDDRAFEPKPFFNISSVDRTNFKMVRNINARRSRRLNFEHLKAIIIQENLVREQDFIAKLLDFYIRDHQMRRRTYIFISDGKGEDVLAQKLPLELMPAISMKMIQDNYPAHNGMPIQSQIGDVSNRILSEESYIIPRISPKKGDFIIAGAGIMSGKENKLIGWLGEHDLAGYNFLIGEAENAIVEAYYEDHLFVYELDNMEKYVTYSRKNDIDQFHILIKTEGHFVEDQLEDVDISDEETLKKVAAALDKEILDICERLTTKLQAEFYADILNLNSILKKKDYHRWKQIKDNWDGEEGFFQKAEIQIEVQSKIRHYMTKQQLV